MDFNKSSILKFLKKNYPLLILLILPSIILLSSHNDTFNSFSINFIWILIVLLGIILVIGLFFLIEYLLELFFQGIAHKDKKPIYLAVKILVFVVLIILYIIYNEEIDRIFFKKF
jgi:hypothetical protein